MTREEAIKLLSQIMDTLLASNSWLPSTDNPIKESFGMAIDALQTDIVRCKECRHAYYADNRVPHERTWVCDRFMNEEINANDFCSWGERSRQ